MNCPRFTRPPYPSLSLFIAALSLLSHLGSSSTDGQARHPSVQRANLGHNIEIGGSTNLEMNHDASDPESQRIRQIILKESRGYDIHSPENTPKRQNYLSWEDYFLAVAYLSAQRSKDPHPSKSSRDGACIVDAMGRIVGIGYDGFPRGCSDDCLPWASDIAESGSDGDSMDPLPWLHTKEPFLCHAEINAILNKCSNDVVGGRMFVRNFPCT